MKLTRDSALLWIPLIGGVAGFGLSHFDVLQRAWPGLSTVWQARIELVAGIAAFLGAYLRMNPLAINPKADAAKAYADPTQALNVIGQVKRKHSRKREAVA